MRLFGLIGYPLSHSFSKKYFREKFSREGIMHNHYELFPIENINQLPLLLKNNPELIGLNVTIPYKQAVLPFLHELDPEAAGVGAVNCIRIGNGRLRGYNTDVYGFKESLLQLIPVPFHGKALVLGTGGAAKAVLYVLTGLGIDYITVSRSRGQADLVYEDIDANVLNDTLLIVNTTPLGMAPNVHTVPSLPYEFLTKKHILYDLVYNPEKTLFLDHGEKQGCRIINGIPMLHLQAEKAWQIWNQK